MWEISLRWCDLRNFECIWNGRGITDIGRAIKRCLNHEKKFNMNTKVLLLGAVITAFAFTSFAAEPLLSPRAQANQIKIVTGSDTQVGAVTSVTSAALSPRAQASQINGASGTDNDFNPYLTCRNSMSGSPKVVAACSADPAMPGCVTVAPLK